MDARMTGVRFLLLVTVLIAGCQSMPEGSGGQPVATIATRSTLPTAESTRTAAPTSPPSEPIAGEAAPQATAVEDEAALQPTGAVEIVEFPVPRGSHPHDVAPAPDGPVWYTAQATGELGKLDPATGETHHIPLGPGSSPHGVIVGPDNAPWITDSGLNAIVRVDPETEAVQTFQLPDNGRNANLNTAVFDEAGVLWFTGQNGFYGRLDPAGGQVEVFEAPRGRGPYGIAATPDGKIYYASLAGSHLGAVDPASGEATMVEPPTANQGARRVWADSAGRL